MDNRWKTMAQDSFDFGFAIYWMRKDLGLALDEARANGATLPVTALVDQFYAAVQAMGGSRQDTSALVRSLARACSLLSQGKPTVDRTRTSLTTSPSCASSIPISA